MTPAEAWTTLEGVKERLRRDWDAGRLPAAVLDEGNGYPLRCAFKVPASGDLANRFAEAKAWISTWQAVERPGLHLEWRDIEHRSLGRNRLPVALVFQSTAVAATLIGKGRDLQRLVDRTEDIVKRYPSLRAWCLRRPLRVIEHDADWPALLACLDWFQAHQRLGCYLRQIDAPGVHSKFIESHRGLLGELLDLVLPPEAIDATAVGAAQFNRRYGLRDKPALVRCRLLDPRLSWGLTLGLSDSEGASTNPEQLALPASNLALLPPGLFTQVFITENEINFLAFPPVRGSLIIFGSGYGFDQLSDCAWLRPVRVRYWGDIDTHGFAILDQLRAQLPHTESFLMDRATLLAHREHWVEEPTPTKRCLPRLTPVEQALYGELCTDNHGPSIRLEQEKIGFGLVAAAIGEDSAEAPTAPAP